MVSLIAKLNGHRYKLEKAQVDLSKRDTVNISQGDLHAGRADCYDGSRAELLDITRNDPNRDTTLTKLDAKSLDSPRTD